MGDTATSLLLAVRTAGNGAAAIKLEEILIELAPIATDELCALVGELDQALSVEYLPEQRHGLAFDAIFQPHVRFFLARLGGTAVGCGGVALYSDFAEVKRMYVRDIARGRGVARAMCAHSLAHARARGFRAMQFNFVVGSNTRAVALWQSLGFEIVGRLPEAFDHPRLGLVDAVVMYRML